MSKRMTLAEFISRANKKHNNKFNYSKSVQFKNQMDKVIVICPDHGEKLVLVGNHLGGSGCNECSGNIKRTTQSFLRELNNIGYLFDEYDYKNVEYKSTNSKVIIIDKKFNTSHSISPKELLKGKKCSSANLTDGYKEFKEVKDFVWSLNLKSEKDWREFSKSGERPWDIPSTPSKKYKNHPKWISGVDFYGLKKGWDGKYLSFLEAREVVRSEDLSNQDEWYEYVRYKKPNNIPSNPQAKYKKEWKSIQDWIGTIPGWDGYNYLPYDKARSFVRKLNLKNRNEWREYCKSGNKPENIPGSPQRYYKEIKFSMGDWLGTGNISNRDKEFWLFTQARNFVHNLNLKSGSEWDDYIDSKDYNINIPKAPGLFYDQYISIGDWLGYLGDGTHAWTKSYILEFIKKLEDQLVALDSIELITIINSNNLAKKIKDLGFLDDLASSKGNSELRKKIVRQITDSLDENEDFDKDDLNKFEDEITLFNEELIEGEIQDLILQTENQENDEELKPLEPLEELKFFDNKLIVASLDDENFDFLLKNQLKKLWNQVLNKLVDVKDINKENGGEKFNLIKKWFFEEYNEVIKIKSPKDYIFKYEPNMMQKLVTYRMVKEKKYGNWSGTGAGKTLSAIFSGRYSNLNNTIIICNNSTVSGWVKSIHEYFDNSLVYTKTKFNDNVVSPELYTVIDKYDIKLTNEKFNYLILNYETFQLGDGDYIVKELLENNRIDYIVLDEVQNVKQRNVKEESTRRNVINKLVIHSKKKNPNLHLMAMSATPIINNLTEPKKLIELLSGESHKELEVKDSIINGIEMYKYLTRYGIRYKPDYSISVKENIIKSDGQHLINKLKKVPKGSPIGFEKVLIGTKLDSVKDYIKKGTLIYTHYVTGLVDQIGSYVESLGLKYGYYTGGDKAGLELFKSSKIDVLIGSAPIGTGVDGIQYVCNTLIPLILPWTSSEYEQLVGRINRQGSFFDNVNIYIPQVSIDLGLNSWSWDKRRYNIIKYKSTLADLAMDGIVPKNLLPPKSTLVKQAQLELQQWIDRISDNDIITFEREELKIPLNPKLLDYHKRKLGDFSELNKKWSISKSENTFIRLKNDPSEWYYYHTEYSEKRKKWTEIPYIEISKKLKERPEWIVADMGCGENLLSKEINNKVYAFDYIAKDGEDVIACDMSNVPLNDKMVDAVVFCLSLMGSNTLDYFKESSRILKPYGNLFICEPRKKVENRLEILSKQIESYGFKIIEIKTDSEQFIYIEAQKR